MSHEIRSFRSHLIKTFRQNYSSVCWEGIYEESSKTNFREINTKPSCFHNGWELHACHLDPDQVSFPRWVEAGTRQQKLLGSVWVSVGRRGGREGGAIPWAQNTGSVPSHSPMQPEALCVIRNSFGFFQSLRNCPSGGVYICVCWGAGEGHSWKCTDVDWQGTRHIIHRSAKSFWSTQRTEIANGIMKWYSMLHPDFPGFVSWLNEQPHLRERRGIEGSLVPAQDMLWV